MKPVFWNRFNKKRGILVHDEKNCSLCGLCEERCPHKAIKVDTSRKIWKLRLVCMKCGRCVKECPEKALRLEPYPDTYDN